MHAIHPIVFGYRVAATRANGERRRASEAMIGGARAGHKPRDRDNAAEPCIVYPRVAAGPIGTTGRSG